MANPITFWLCVFKTPLSQETLTREQREAQLEAERRDERRRKAEEAKRLADAMLAKLPSSAADYVDRVTNAVRVAVMQARRGLVGQGRSFGMAPKTSSARSHCASTRARATCRLQRGMGTRAGTQAWATAARESRLPARGRESGAHDRRGRQGGVCRYPSESHLGVAHRRRTHQPCPDVRQNRAGPLSARIPFVEHNWTRCQSKNSLPVATLSGNASRFRAAIHSIGRADC
jgi:hypothetical protein